jgi:predicted PurR-regulated permease PerM
MLLLRARVGDAQQAGKIRAAAARAAPRCEAAGGFRAAEAEYLPGRPAMTPDRFVRQVATVLALTLPVLLLTALLVLGVKVLMAAFGGVLLAILLHACADVVRRHTPLPYGWSLAVVLVALVAVLGGAGWLLAPQVSQQIDELAAKLPEIADEIRRFLERYGWGRSLLERTQDGEIAQNALAGGAGVLAALSTWSGYILTAVFVGLFGAANPGLYRDGLIGLVPLKHRERTAELLDALALTLRSFLIGQGITMLIIGVSTTIVLMAFGIPVAIVVGILVGLLGFIPYLGPIIGAVPVAAVAALQGIDTLLWVMVAYTAVQLLEGYVAVPIVQKRLVYLPPVFTIIAQILLGVVLGLLGFILATPLAAVLLVLSRFYRRDILGEADVELAGGKE